MKSVYVAHPLRGDVQRNFNAVSAGSIRGPYTRPLLPSLGRTLREGYTPLWVRGLEPRELAVIEGQREREVKS